LGRKFYIRHLSGDDSNDGRSAERAWKTFFNVNKSDSVIIAGDTVYAGAGAYHKTDAVNTDGEIRPTKIWDGAVSFIADRNGDFTGDAGEVAIARLAYQDYMKVKGFTIYFNVDSTAGAGGTAIDLQIEECVIYGDCRIARPSGNAVFRNNIVGWRYALGGIGGSGFGGTFVVLFIGGTRDTDPDQHWSNVIDAGKLICEFNTIHSSSTAGLRGIFIQVLTNDKFLNQDGAWFKNNMIVDSVIGVRTEYLMFWEPQRAEDWDWNWHIDNNFYAYGDYDGLFAHLIFFFESDPADFVMATLSDWQSAVSVNAYGFVMAPDGAAVEGDPLFDTDFRHITAGSTAIGAALPIPDTTDFELDDRETVQDIGADEYFNEAPGDNYIFTSKIYGHIADEVIPTRAYFKFDFFVYPNDWVRLLASWNGGYRWWEIVNTNTDKYLIEEELVIPGSVRGRNFMFKVEIFQHASNRGLPDFGVEDMSKLRTELVTQEDIQENLKPGMELDFWSIQFPGERAATVVVDKYGNFRTYVWPGSYRVKMVGGGKLAGREVIIAKGFSDTFARFGVPHCMNPQQYNWSDFEQQFMGIEWAQYGVMELFNNEDGRFNPEPAPLPALVRCGKLVKGQTGSRKVFMACNPTLK